MWHLTRHILRPVAASVAVIAASSIVPRCPQRCSGRKDARARQCTSKPFSRTSRTCYAEDFQHRSGASVSKLVSSSMSSWQLWLPFWRQLILPIAGVACWISLLDGLFWQMLSSAFAPASALAFCISLFDRLGFFVQQEATPSRNVSIETEAWKFDEKGAQTQPPMELRCAVASMRGWRPTMEDAHLAAVMQSPCGGNLGVFAVFDGHGGWQVSEATKQLLLPLLSSNFEKLEDHVWLSGDQDACEKIGASMADTVAALDAILLAGPFGLGHFLNKEWIHPFGGVGSTSCIAMLDLERKRIVVANTGDSRAILCRNGRAIALTEDHKPEDEEESSRILRAGGRVVRTGPCYRVDGGLNLSRALGDFCYKANSRLPMTEQKVISTPTVTFHEWSLESSDEFLVVACDGLFERMTRQDVVNYVREGLAKGTSSEDIMRGLLLSCCARSRYEPGQDNETAILVQWASSAHAKTTSNI